MYRKKKWDLILILILVYCMPFHSIFFAVTGLQAFVMWRDLLVAFTLIVIFLRQNGKVYVSVEGILIAIALLFTVIHAVFFHSSSIANSLWINTLRIYIGTFFVYYIGRYCSADVDFFKLLQLIYVRSAIAISVWGIFQMFFLGRDFLYRVGYSISSAVLSNGFQRNVGVFSSANLMGCYIVIAIILLLYGNVEVKHKNRYAYILVISLLLTFSTSAILGLICCVILNTFSKHDVKKILLIQKKYMNAFFSVCLFIVIAIIADRLLLDGKIYSLIAGRIDELALAIKISDVSRGTSASVHLDDLIRSIDVVKNNLMGVGFSTSTFMLLNRVPREILTNAVESSLFTILFDFGLFVGSLYIIPFLYPIFNGFLKKKYDYPISKMVMLSLIILYIFLPLVSSIELRFFAFLFLGLESNLKIKKKDNHE